MNEELVLIQITDKPLRGPWEDLLRLPLKQARRVMLTNDVSRWGLELKPDDVLRAVDPTTRQQYWFCPSCTWFTKNFNEPHRDCQGDAR